MKYCRNFLRNNPLTVLLTVLALLGAPLQAQVGLFGAEKPATTSASMGAPDSTKITPAAADTLPVRVIKKELNPREQVLVGTTIMFFIITVMAFMNNFNPN